MALKRWSAACTEFVTVKQRRRQYTMSSSQPNPKGQGTSTAIEPKARGANRSTKVAGKLKVLPDQPEPVVPIDKVEPPPPPKKPEGEGSATAEDSEDDDGDDEAEAEDTEEVEVSVRLSCASFVTRHVSAHHTLRSTTNWTEFLQAPHEEMRCV